MNSTLAVVPSGLWNYDNNDRLATDTYDNDGNTTWSVGIQNQYDFENHLIQHGAITYQYDGDGNRVSKTIAGVATYYLVDTDNPTGYAQVVDEITGPNIVKHTYGLTHLWQHTGDYYQGFHYSFYGYDGHGSVRYLTDPNGTVTDTYDYDAYGNLINRTGTTDNNYLYAGEQFDPDLGLYYNRARYLDVRMGRFWGMDDEEGSESDPASLHRYLYAGANPANMVDPSGHEYDLVSTLGTAAIVGFLAATATSLYLGKGFWTSIGYGVLGAIAAAGLVAGVLTGGALTAAVFSVPVSTGMQAFSLYAAGLGIYGAAVRYSGASPGKQKNLAMVGMVMAMMPFISPSGTVSPENVTELDVIDAIGSRAGAKSPNAIGYLTWDIDGQEGGAATVSGVKPRIGTIGVPASRRFNPTEYSQNDVEVKLLEELATKITPSSVGKARIVINKNYVCMSCVGVVGEFRQQFPGVAVTVDQASGAPAEFPW